jgi:hypothetical protein
MYEIVVGRTPFEKSEAEEFLTREALEVYCSSLLVPQSKEEELTCPCCLDQIIELRRAYSAATLSSRQVRVIDSNECRSSD